MTLTTIAPGVRLLRRHPATDALIAERKTSANLRAEVRRLQERGILKRLLRRVVG